MRYGGGSAQESEGQQWMGVRDKFGNVATTGRESTPAGKYRTFSHDHGPAIRGPSASAPANALLSYSPSTHKAELRGAPKAPFFMRRFAS